MQILRAAEDYLEAMLMMQQKHGYIRSIDIAEQLGVTKPSVTYTTKRLRENGYITMDRDGLITLTPSGMDIASRMLDRHHTLTKFLMELGVDAETAEEDACKMEHDISEQTYAALCRHAIGKLGILAVILAALIVLYEFGLRYRTVAITRVGQLVAQEASRRLGVPFGIIDLSLAPTPAVGDSVGEVLEKIGLEQVGAPGTTAALAMLNDQVKKGGIMASSYVGGLSGAFIPVSEDKNMIDAAASGCLTLEKLEAMTCVCSVGLDMIAIPGDTSAATISGMIADEAAIGMVNQKTTAVRVIPVAGKGVGEMANFGGLMGYAPIMPVNQTSCEAFVTRGGRIPAPIHSFKN